MYTFVDYHIKGLAPHLMHNSQLADPLNEWAIAMKAISGKRKKTEEDLNELARLEFMGSLYLRDGKPCVPGITLEAMFRDAAKMMKRGKDVQKAVIVPEDHFLIYEGPKDPEKLWETGKFHDRSIVVVNRQRVARTRPKFFPWELKFRLGYMPDIFDRKDIDHILDIAGMYVCLSDFRPRYGKFEVVGSGKQAA